MGGEILLNSEGWLRGGSNHRPQDMRFLGLDDHGHVMVDISEPEWELMLGAYSDTEDAVEALERLAEGLPMQDGGPEASRVIRVKLPPLPARRAT